MLRRNLSFIIFLFTLLTIISAVIAKDVEISPSASDITLYTGKTESIDVTIKNNRALPDTLSISVFPNFVSGISATLENYAVRLDGNSEMNLKLYFSSTLDAPELTSAFNLSVMSIANTTIFGSAVIYLRTVRTVPVYISDIKISKYVLDPSETLSVGVQLTNLASNPSDQYTLQTTIKKDGEVIQKFDNIVANIGGRSSKIVTNDFFVGKYATPGDYTIESILKDTIDRTISTKSSSFKVNALSKIPPEFTEKATSVGFLSVTTTIKVKNEGNAPSPNFYLTESIPIFAQSLFYPETEADVKTVGDRVVYSWFIPSLQPGQEMIIVYKFSLWQIWLVLVIIFVVVYISFNLSFVPVLTKKTRHIGELKKEKEILVILEAKNNSLMEVKDIFVTDRVPSIVKIVERFDTVRPLIKQTETGTELTWKFDSLKAREERVLTYRIKPMMDIVGTLVLPSATLRYSTRKKERKFVVSKSILVSGRR